MPAQVISLCDYQKKKGARKRSRDEKGSDKVKAPVIHIGTFKANKSLRGRGFPDDFFFGPDDAPEDFGLIGLFSGLSGMNLCLDNPNFPYEPEDDKE